ncbi:Putative protein of unknown function [Podospora comata]|uniref:RNA 3'-terminal phosphate cyclase domain-containing protein n=1 Tax=Podospora comata TaxID=48703 RepID=A0ABY6SDY7_PODCO|nr:Putative protein of unknown function [Podospora comata]
MKMVGISNLQRVHPTLTEPRLLFLIMDRSIWACFTLQTTSAVEKMPTCSAPYSHLPRRYRFLILFSIVIASFHVLSWDFWTLFNAMSNRQNRLPPLTLDGTTYEGGGGLIRYAIAYSSLLNRPVTIHSIRANRPGIGGLRPEHTAAIATLAELASAEVTGNLPASRQVTFNPHADSAVSAKHLPLEMDITVEGSASIFLIAMLPYLLFGHIAAHFNGFASRLNTNDGLRLTIRAGTLCVKAPSFPYLQQVLLPTLGLIGIGSENLKLEPEQEQGWHTENKKYPGKMVAWIKPLSKPLPAFILERRGKLQSIRVTAHVPRHAMKRFEEILHSEVGDTFKTRTEKFSLAVEMFASDPEDQYHLLISAATEAPKAYLGYEQVFPQSDVFPREIEGDVDKIAVLLVRSCIHGIWAELRRGNAVDEHAEDILVFYQSVASGFSSIIAPDNEVSVPEINLETSAIKSGSQYEVNVGSMHRQTSWWMVETMTGVRQETRHLGGKDRVGCEGFGLGK